MNILLDQLPDTVEIDGKEYLINSDFRTGLRIILAMEDGQLTNYEKAIVMLQNLYPVVPDNVQAALEQGSKFLNGGKTEVDGNADPVRLYSFAKDANFIFAAFRQTHGIDLETAELHWWKFMALFMDLGTDTTFCSLTGLRKRLADGTATKEEKKAAREMGDLVELDEQEEELTQEEREKDEEFMRLLNLGKQSHG